VNDSLGEVIKLIMGAASSATGDGLAFHLAASVNVRSTGATYIPNTTPAGASADIIDEDQILVNNGPSDGFLLMRFTVEGTERTSLGSPALSSNMTGNTEIALNMERGPGQFFRLDGDVGNFSKTVTTELPFSGTQAHMLLTLAIDASCVEGFTSGPVDCAALIDLANTVRITGVGVEDLNHTVIQDATLTSGSGIIYPSLTSTPVPEPSTAALTGVTLLAVLFTTRHRNRHRERNPGERVHGASAPAAKTGVPGGNACPALRLLDGDRRIQLPRVHAGDVAIDDEYRYRTAGWNRFRNTHVNLPYTN